MACIGHRAGGRVSRGGFGGRAPQEQPKDPGHAALLVARNHLRRAEHIDDRLDAARLLRVSTVAFEFCCGVGQSHQQRKMSTGRSAGNANAIRIDLIFFSICAQPANGGFRVVNLGGEGLCGGGRFFFFRVEPHQAVCDRHRDISALGGLGNMRQIRTTVSGVPTAAVNKHQGGKRARAFRGPGQIELEFQIARVAVDKILFDCRLSGQQRRHDQRGDQQAQRSQEALIHESILSTWRRPGTTIKKHRAARDSLARRAPRLTDWRRPGASLL